MANPLVKVSRKAAIMSATKTSALIQPGTVITPEVAKLHGLTPKIINEHIRSGYLVAAQAELDPQELLHKTAPGVTVNDEVRIKPEQSIQTAARGGVVASVGPKADAPLRITPPETTPAIVAEVVSPAPMVAAAVAPIAAVAPVAPPTPVAAPLSLASPVEEEAAPALPSIATPGPKIIETHKEVNTPTLGMPAVSIWTMNPSLLIGKGLDELNIMIQERDDTIDPRPTVNEAIKLLSQDYAPAQA